MRILDFRVWKIIFRDLRNTGILQPLEQTQFYLSELKHIFSCKWEVSLLQSYTLMEKRKETNSREPFSAFLLNTWLQKMVKLSNPIKTWAFQIQGQNLQICLSKDNSHLKDKTKWRTPWKSLTKSGLSPSKEEILLNFISLREREMVLFKFVTKKREIDQKYTKKWFWP